MEKYLAIACGDQIKDVSIGPGTTTAEILKHIGLKGFWLSKGDGLPFADNEQLYGIVEDGQKLHASPPANVA